MPIDEPDDLSRHVAAAREGDAGAARSLVEGLYPQVMRIVRSHRPQQTGEEDLAQEIFIKMFSRLGQYQARDGIPFTHWISRLAVRTCLDRLRAERRRPEVSQSDLSPDESRWIDFLSAESASESPSDTADFSAVEAVSRLLSALSADDRLVIQWLDLDQKSVREVSELTGWSRPAVKVRAFRARHRLRRIAENFRKQIHS